MDLTVDQTCYSEEFVQNYLALAYLEGYDRLCSEFRGETYIEELPDGTKNLICVLPDSVFEIPEESND